MHHACQCARLTCCLWEGFALRVAELTCVQHQHMHVQEASGRVCRCWLCQKGGSRQFRDLGPLLHLAINDKGTEMKWLHRQCLLWSPEVSEGRGSELVNVPKAVFRGRHINCKVCSSFYPGLLLTYLLSCRILTRARLFVPVLMTQLSVAMQH